MERTISTSRGTMSYVLTKKNIKTMYLRVKKEGVITVSAPTRLGVKEIDKFVQSNEAFIFKVLDSLAEKALQAPEDHAFSPGEQFDYLGNALSLEVREGLQTETRQEQGLLVVVLPFGTITANKIEEKIALFFQQETLRIFSQLMAYHQDLLAPLDIPQAILKIRKMKSQWGSCHRGKNVITLNSALIHVPFPLIEYVVLHEFCHFIHGNHSKAFWDLVAVYMPDWKTRRQALKQWNEVV